MLEVKNVSYTYQSKYQLVNALKDVSCSFETGKFYVIEGRSGSGKTTLLSLLAGLDIPTKGEILWKGTPYQQLDMEQLRRESLAIIFQTFNLFPLLTVAENIIYPMQLIGKAGGQAKDLVKELLGSVGLGDGYLKKFPAMLSGGEQQRVAIARALASGANVILADEPTGNLDTENGRLVVEILRRLVEEKDYCVIFITHDKSIAEQADILYYMQDGMMVTDYTREENANETANSSL